MTTYDCWAWWVNTFYNILLPYVVYVNKSSQLAKWSISFLKVCDNIFLGRFSWNRNFGGACHCCYPDRWLCFNMPKPVQRCQVSLRVTVFMSIQRIGWFTWLATGPAGSDHYFCPDCPSVCVKSFKIKQISLPAGTVGCTSGSSMALVL